MFELAWKVSKDNNDLLWWAIVGLTEQVLLEKIEHSQYVLETGTLQSHVTRLAFHNEEYQQVFFIINTIFVLDSFSVLQ